MFRPKLRILIVILLVYSSSSGQFSPGARHIAMSHSDVAYCNDVFSQFINPAGLALLSGREFGVYYSPAPFGLKELANGNAAYVENTSAGNFAAGFSVYGFELYKENKFALSWADNFLGDIYFGATLIYQNLSIKNYGGAGAFNLILGGAVKPADKLFFGFSIENPFHFTYGKYSNQIPVSYSAGAGYLFSERASLFFSVYKELGFKECFSLGAEYYPVKFLAVRLGIQNEPQLFSGGVGIEYSIFKINYSAVYHYDLGLTHQAGVRIVFESSKEIF